MVDAAIERTLSIRMAISASAAKTPSFVPAFSAHNRNMTKDTGLLHSLL